MKKDCFGLTVTTESDIAIDVINHFSQQLMCSGKHADAVLIAATQHPDNILIQCFAAAYNLFIQETASFSQASAYLQAAEKLLPIASQREQIFYQAICAWHKLDYELALTLLIAQTELWQRDCVAAKIAEWLFYCTGQKHQAKRFLKMCKKMRAHQRNNNHFMAIDAFALELNRKFDRSYTTAMQALDIDVATPWAHHALSHVFLMTNRVEAGITALEKFQPSWEDILPPLKGHNTWHLGLFYLANRDEQKVKKTYNEIIQLNLPEIMPQQIDSISLLWRMDMAGISQNENWEKIIPHLGQHPFQHFMPFNNAHCIYALARAQNITLATEVIKIIEQYAATQSGEKRRLWHTITHPLLRGCVAFAQQQYREASDLLQPVIENVFCVGGSDAQDELFLQTYFLSLRKSGQHKAATRFFKKYLAHYKNTALGDYWETV